MFSLDAFVLRRPYHLILNVSNDGFLFFREFTRVHSPNSLDNFWNNILFFFISVRQTNLANFNPGMLLNFDQITKIASIK